VHDVAGHIPERIRQLLSIPANLDLSEDGIAVRPDGSTSGILRKVDGGTGHRGDTPIGEPDQALDGGLLAPEPSVSIGGEIAEHAAGLVGLTLALIVLGFGLVTFLRPNLEIVSDTVTHSLGRAFLAGLLGQMLVLPTFALLVGGLALTIAGVLLLPFAITVYVLLALIATVGGLLAVAHAMGERITRRRMARGILVSPNSYRYLVTGLAAIAAIWIGWVLFGWVPLAGTLMLAVAALSTWTVATVGFGAALLSRGGIHEHFAGRLLGAETMTDEYLWATPQFGVPVVKRPGRQKS
jgi:hypothetical protein